MDDVDVLGLPPLEGGLPPHQRPELPEMFAPSLPKMSSEAPTKSPSARKRQRSGAPIPRSTDWSECKPWVLSTFETVHALLKPVLAGYLQRSTRCRSAESFFKAFFAREGGRAARALA